MTQRLQENAWFARFRRLFTGARQRHFADLSTPNANQTPKLEPISKILANTGRDSATPAD